MSGLVKVGRTTKGVYNSIVAGGFLIDFPDSEFRNESGLIGFGDVFVRRDLVGSFNRLRNKTISQNGSFPIESDGEEEYYEEDYSMTAQEILNNIIGLVKKTNWITGIEGLFSNLLVHKNRVSGLGDYEQATDDGIYDGYIDGVKGRFYEKTIRFKDYQVYILQRDFHSGDDDLEYQGSAFFEVRNRYGKFDIIKELWC